MACSSAVYPDTLASRPGFSIVLCWLLFLGGLMTGPLHPTPSLLKTVRFDLSRCAVSASRSKDSFIEH